VKLVAFGEVYKGGNNTYFGVGNGWVEDADKEILVNQGVRIKKENMGGILFQGGFDANIVATSKTLIGDVFD